MNVDTWRGYRSLGVFLKTDAEGRFRVGRCPAREVPDQRQPDGFARSLSEASLPEEQAITLILKRSLAISGRITDAITDKPIDQTRVEIGVADRHDR